MDVSRDWRDIHCLPGGQRHRIPNPDDGHIAVSDLAHKQAAVVCFEATGGQEWRLWTFLKSASIDVRQVPPAHAKAFARSLGTRARSDRTDAELIARFIIFRPGGGRALPAEHHRLLRALTTGWAQVVKMRKRLLAQLWEHRKSATAALTGLDLVAQDSGTLRGKRAIAGGRHVLRHVLFQAALRASHHNPTLKAYADRLRNAGKSRTSSAS
ncbi:transposase [Citreicella sp. C3M06]|uniref:IS110 family transposase n=1 Tax=Citreicella sp. C3M06 TaxID=2841564 RepID=UPI001C08D545|nr:transposase [Citreicella sp. C3M06]MBU2961439.1 transposase [Citreicella sp. C3M06]